MISNLEAEFSKLAAVIADYNIRDGECGEYYKIFHKTCNSFFMVFLTNPNSELISIIQQIINHENVCQNRGVV